MSHRIRAAALAAALSAVSLTGCSSSGLSPREVPARSQSSLLYSLYDSAAVAEGAAAAEPARPLRLPAAVAVVQVGEVAPPRPMIDALSSDPAVFARVVTLPGTESIAPVYHFDRDMDSAARQSAAARATASASRRSVEALRRLAADAGADHLLLVGGTVDYGSAITPLSLLDLTIVGAFAVPSRETRATARATAALIDVRSGRVVQTSSAEVRRRSLAPAAAVKADRTKLLEALRDDVVGKLAAQVLADARARAAGAPPVAVGDSADGGRPPL